jgi:hypothetical protein
MSRQVHVCEVLVVGQDPLVLLRLIVLRRVERKLRLLMIILTLVDRSGVAKSEVVVS